MDVALDGETAAVGQDQVDIALDCDAGKGVRGVRFADGHIAVYHIPGVLSVLTPGNGRVAFTARHLGGAGTGFCLQFFCAAVPVIIGYIRRRQRRGRQQR